MNKIDDFFLSYKKHSPSHLQTLRSLERAFNDANIEFPRSKISDGIMPFSEFSHWLARKFAKSKMDGSGCWSRYDGNCWRLIRENVVSEDEHYDTFFRLYGEFKEISPRLYQVAEMSSSESESAGQILRIEVWKCSPDSGFLKYLCFADGDKRHDGFFSSLEDVAKQSQLEDGVTMGQWTVV